jgi:hypothetical protein
MDIYEPRVRKKKESGVLKYMIEVEGYKEGDVEVCTLREQYDQGVFDIRQVKNVYQDQLRVDIITSASFCAIALIFYFHSMVVFNWILPDGYFSAYPRLACGQKGLLNPMALT